MNAAIAIFGGWELKRGDKDHLCARHDHNHPDEGCTCYLKCDGFVKGNRLIYHYQLKYHEDWNQLMKVVEKISTIKLAEYESHQDVHYPRTFGMPSQDGGVMVRFNCAPVWAAPTLIEATFIAVYDFIQHFTTTKQKD